MPRRVQGLRLEPSSEAPVAQEPVQLGDRDRLGVPQEIAKGISWLSGIYALGVLNEPGKIVLLDWEAESNTVLATRARLVDAADWEGLRLLEDRYRRIALAKDYRITLTLSHVLHLGVPVLAGAYVYVCRVGDGVEVMSPQYRDKQLAGAASAFTDLP